MAWGNARSEIAGQRSRLLLALLIVLTLATGTVRAQVTATITGSVKDSTAAVVPGAAVTAKNLETGLTRIGETDTRGNYRFSALPVGQYEVSAEKAGFKLAVRRGITLVVAQQAIVDLALEVGAVEQTVTVTAAAPLVNTTLSSTAGVIGEREVAELPLAGRSFDQLLTLNAATADYSSQAARNSFSISGRRPDENRFTINGIEWGGNSTNAVWDNPQGVSGQVLGVDAMREFNVQTDTYGAEYGKRVGGQVTIVTKSGTNQLHGSVFHYLRNDKLDARNFFNDQKRQFKRNQFGGSLGGPIVKDKLFIFGSYEGFRQRLGGSGQAVVPDLDARRGFLPIGPGGSLIQVSNLKPQMLEYTKLWREPNRPSIGGGAALIVTNPVQAIREDFGLLRVDSTISTKDTLAFTFLRDDGIDESPGNASPSFSTEILQNTVAGVQETRVFSPSVVNVFTAGMSRGLADSSSLLTIDFPRNLRIFEGSPVPGSIRIGGSLFAGLTAVASTGGSGPPQTSVKTYYTISDDLHYTRGNHSLSFGVWVQRTHENSSRGSAPGGFSSYPSLEAFLQDLPTTIQGGSPHLPMFGFRYTQAAFYVQDEIKLWPNFSLRLGFRNDSLTMNNEVNCRASNYFFDEHEDLIPEPNVGCALLKENRNKFLPQPRVGLAWDPTGTGKWSVRAGWGLYNNIFNIASFMTNPPFKGVLSFDRTPLLSIVPIPATATADPSCTAERVARGIRCQTYTPFGVFPTYKTTTISQWNLAIEREVVRDLMLRVGYNGSQGYHVISGQDANTIRPLVCQNAAGCVSGGVLAASQRGLVPQGMTYIPVGQRPSPFVSNSLIFFFNAANSYNGLDLTLQKRFSQGFSIRTNYTFSKSFDINSSYLTSTGTNSPQTTASRYDLSLNRGVSSFSVKHQFNSNFSVELPFGSGKPFGSSATGFWDKLISGWQWNGILRSRSGFPFTPTVGTNRSGNGDSRSPDTPNRNPNFTGSITSGTTAGCAGTPAGQKLGTPERYYDPCAFDLPIAGTFGNVGRGTFRGPGSFNVDTSLFKRIPLSENWNMQFRFEVFNAFNQANFASPQFVTFSGANRAPAAGRITSTSTTSREIQFALRLSF